MKKKICMIVPSFSAKGGITTVVNGIKNSNLNDEYSIKYIESYCDGGKIRKIFKFLFSYINYVFVLLFFRPDFIHVHMAFGASYCRKLFFMKLAFLLKIPVICHIHASEFDKFYSNKSFKKKKNIISNLDRCKYIIVLSEEWKQKFSNLINSNKLYIVENFGEINVKNVRKCTNYIVTFMGFITKNKGCFDIPKVIYEVKKVIPNVKFIIAGTSNKADLEKFDNLVKKYQIQDNVVLPGWVDKKQKDEILKSSDLYFLPSYNEGMPMSILEAMGYGLPIVSTNVGGIPQLVINKKNGFLLNFGDIDGFSKCIIKILSDEDVRKKYGEYSLNILSKKYSVDIFSEKLNVIYKMID